MTSRDKILLGIRQALRRGDLSSSEKATLAKRFNEHPHSILSKRAELRHPELVHLFVSHAEKAEASVYHLATLTEASATILDYLQKKQIALNLCLSHDPLLDVIQWHPEFILKKGLPDRTDLVSVTHSFCGVAETGTLVLLSSETSPTTLNFLPETHFVLLSTKNIVAYYEDAWNRIRRSGLDPRIVNFITGPSRTADIEQTVQIGMHGPKQLCILLYYA